MELPSTLDTRDVAALAELYDQPAAMPEWCDLTPEVELTPADGEGFSGVRIT